MDSREWVFSTQIEWRCDCTTEKYVFMHIWRRIDRLFFTFVAEYIFCEMNNVGIESVARIYENSFAIVQGVTHT